MNSAFADSRWLVYAALNLLFCAALLTGASASGGSLAALPYVTLLFALCSSPIPFIDRANGAFAMLGVAMAIYFATFGLLDTVSVFSPAKASGPEGFITPGERVILLAVLMLIVGFHLAAGITKSKSQAVAAQDWPASMLVLVGLLLWSAGCVANLYLSLVLVTEATNAAVTAGFTKLGIWLTSGLVLIQVYAGPLGIIILAYWWSIGGRRMGNWLIALVIAVQFVVGWVVDTKSVAISPLFIILLTRFFVVGRVSWRLALVAVVGTALLFPILTAKRVIMQEAHWTRAQALPHTAEIMWRAIEQQDVYRTTHRYGDPTSSFLERATDKASVEIFATSIGITHPFKMGSTLGPLLYAFIPRVLWSDKPSANSAQTFNREFHISADPDTYISPTHIGELYWNFGFLGVIFGMAFAGALLGFISVRFDPSQQTSLTGVLVIMVTIYELVVNRGGSIGNEYVVWLRTLLLIGVLHLLFFKAKSQRFLDKHIGAQEAKESGASEPVPYPNLLR